MCMGKLSPVTLTVSELSCADVEPWIEASYVDCWREAAWDRDRRHVCMRSERAELIGGFIHV